MDYRRVILFITLFCINAQVGNTQNSSLIQLREGEQLPDVSFTAYVGKNATQINTKNLKGKIILFDFWGTGCSSCIAAMPKLLELKQKFKDKMEVFLITTNSKKEIDEYLKELAEKKILEKQISAGKSLSYVYGDTLLSKFFPYDAVPVQAWIGSNQKFIAFADASSATVENVESLLAGKPVEFNKYFKPDLSMWDFDSKEWIKRRFGNGDNALSFSAFFRFDSLSNPSSNFLKDSLSKKITGLVLINQNLLDLYHLAFYGRGSDRSKSLISVEIKDRQRFHQPFYGASGSYKWRVQNKFSYLLKVAVQDTAELYTRMQTDLNREFSLRSNFEKRTIKCFVLKKRSTDKMPNTNQPGQKLSKEGKINEQVVSISPANVRGYLWAYLIGGFADDSRLFCVLDEVDYSEFETNIELPVYNSDGISVYEKPELIDELNNSLKKYGLELITEFKEQNVLVIKDSK